MLNATACIAVTLGAWVEGIQGEDAIDGSGMMHPGLIPTGIAILQAEADTIKEIRMRAEEVEGIFVADFTHAAQTPRTYGEYLENIAKIASMNLTYLGVALYGEKRSIVKLTRRLALLK